MAKGKGSKVGLSDGSPKSARSRRKSVDLALNKKGKVELKDPKDGRRQSKQYVVKDEKFVLVEEAKPFHMTKAFTKNCVSDILVLVMH